MKRLPFFLVMLFLVQACFGIKGVSPVQAAEKDGLMKIIVSILPQEYFVKRIGGERVQVTTLVQPGHSPATYAPTPKQMTSLASSKIYFRIGVPFENALIPKLTRSVPGITIIDLRQGIKMIPMEESHSSEEHDHGELDPHTWLDPRLALQQSALIRDTLIHFDPLREKEYQINYDALARDLQQLDKQLKHILQPFSGKTIYVFHPAYGYFCRAYGLKQKAINPGGKNPGAIHIARLIEQAKMDNVHAIFVQPQFSDKAARTIARSINGSVVALDPLARDYLLNMKSMAKQLALLLPKQTP